MTLEIVSPEATLFSGTITSLYLPGLDGDFQILNNHAPIVSLLKKGVVKIAAPNFSISKEASSKFTKINEQLYTLSVESGTVEMKDNKIILLAD